jgi:hypothetical protein
MNAFVVIAAGEPFGQIFRGTMTVFGGPCGGRSHRRAQSVAEIALVLHTEIWFTASPAAAGRCDASFVLAASSLDFAPRPDQNRRVRGAIP